MFWEQSTGLLISQDSSCKVLVTFPSRFAMWGTGKRRAETKKV
ncbi:hypothetical protein OOU_Y34scaffold00194g75 [Pyricularia oryzae Y34]|uniref:Uncharacterized protein n=2 Tax=Pyricularia oryzae TaxID=318829 RepID=A0AA97P6V2_PYRO3|nr:hypothetical protein OOU_Y34scaffold00194g75 [Pyricularia oryzae Y34]